MTAYFNPLNWFRWAGQFLVAWIGEIQWRGSLGAVPALVVIVLTIGGTAIAWSGSRGWRGRMVERQLGQALKQENHEISDLLLERRLREEPDDVTLRLQLASVRHSNDQTAEATELFRELAFQDNSGQAAEWLLRNSFEIEKSADWDDTRWEEYGRLAEIALKADPERVEFHGRRAQYLLKKREFRDAIYHMEYLIPSQPMRALEAAALARSINDEQNAVRLASGLETKLADLILENPKDPQLRVDHARVLIFLKKYRPAAESLMQGFEQTGEQSLRPLIAQALVLLAEDVRKQSDSLQAKVASMKLIAKASAAAPAEPMVMRAISDTILETMNEENEELSKVREQLLEGAEPGIAHFVKGTVAMLNGEADVANVELQLAMEAMPQSPAILNNLAVAKLREAEQIESPEDAQKVAEQALQLINQAIDVAGKAGRDRVQQLYFAETRGQTYLALSRPLEAIPEFEKALTVEALKLPAHEGLQAAYEALNQPESATLHREAAAAIREKMEAEAAEQKQGLDAFEQGLRDKAKQGGDAAKPVDGTDNANEGANAEGRTAGEGAVENNTP